MKPLNIYSFIIDNTRIKVDKNLFVDCKEGDEVEFHIVPISQHRIRIEKRKVVKHRY